MSVLSFGGISNSSYKGPLNAYDLNTSFSGYQTNLTNATFYNFSLSNAQNQLKAAIFNFEYNTLSLPAINYDILIGFFNKTMKNIFTCSATNGCLYNGLCSDIIPQFPPQFQFNFTFSDDLVYVVPYQSFLVEDAELAVCRLMVSKGANNDRSIVMGTPWFRSFYTLFDANNMQVSFALNAGGFGQIY